MKEVTELLRSDAAFSSQMLRLANSSLYGFTSQIDSVLHATVILGLERVKGLTLTVAMGRYQKAAMKIGVLRRCWRHSLACALLSEELAAACSIHKDRAYTGGIIHDIGRLGLLVAYPNEYANLLSVAAENSFDVIECERQLFDIDHCAAGRWLAEEWKFPSEFAEIAARHHDEEQARAFDMISLVRHGCLLADTLGFEIVKPLRNWSFEELRAQLPEAAQARFQQDPEELKERINSRINPLD